MKKDLITREGLFLETKMPKKPIGIFISEEEKNI
jgi:hypothetical protein